MSILYLSALFLAKVTDNALSTTKAILVQRNKPILAGIALAISNYIGFLITKHIVTDNGNLAILIVSLASGVGCYLAIKVSSRFSHDRTYVNVIMSDNKEAMQDLRDFLAEHHITNVATDSYTLDWNTKSITVTAYAETKEQSGLINDYINMTGHKFKRKIQVL